MDNKHNEQVSQSPTTDSMATHTTHIDQTNQDFQSSVEERKQSVHSFRVTDAKSESDADKDLIIHSLHESLHIHKEILERIQNEKERYQQQMEEERAHEQQSMLHWRETSQRELEEQNSQCQRMEASLVQLKQELEQKKEENKKLAVNFYSYVKQIRATDDDLSTIQPEISHLLSQLNNSCMGLKSKMDRAQGTQFVWTHWPDKIDLIQKYMMPADTDLLDTSFITLFVEKYLINQLLEHILDVPIHLGVSINHVFKELDTWMASRNKEWSNRLRQQLCALVVQQPGDEEVRIQEAKHDLLHQIVSDLGSVYPILKQDPKKIENLIQRASKLNLAVKGQEIKIERLPVEEGRTRFDPQTMKATAKGKPNGIVFLGITPTFIARDELDNEHGFTVPGKVFCIEEEAENQKEIDDAESKDELTATATDEEHVSDEPKEKENVSSETKEEKVSAEPKEELVKEDIPKEDSKEINLSKEEQNDLESKDTVRNKN